jgi:hypothetical protein
MRFLSGLVNNLAACRTVKIDCAVLGINPVVISVNADVARMDSGLMPNPRFTHRPIPEALSLLLEGGKPEFTSEFS